MDTCNNIVECGHKVHIECVKKSGRAKCPMCRKSLNIEVVKLQLSHAISYNGDDDEEGSEDTLVIFEDDDTIAPRHRHDYLSSREDDYHENLDDGEEEDINSKDDWEYEDV